MPHQDDETREVSDALLPQYTEADIRILHEIVALATTIPENGSQPFNAIWRAYDTVLAARKIDPTHDSVYFRFAMQLQAAPGENFKEKFIYMLDQLDFDVDRTQLDDDDDLPPELTEEYNRAWPEDANARRSLSEEGEEAAYHAEDELGRRDRDVNPIARDAEARSRSRSRASRIGRGSSPKDQLDDAARTQQQQQRQALLERRDAPPVGSSDEDVVVQTADEDISPRVPEDAADRLFALHLRATTRQYLRLWKSRTKDRIEEKWFADVEVRAERDYNIRLMAKAWSLWGRQTEAIAQRSHEMRQRILARKCFNAWRDLAESNRSKVQIFQLSCAFRRWRRAFETQCEREQRATRTHNRRLAVGYYWNWCVKLWDITAPRYHDNFLRNSMFCRWTARMDEISRLGASAEELFRRRTLQAVFSHWVQRTERNVDRQEWAYDYSEWRPMELLFSNWRRQALEAPLVKVMREYVDDRVMYDCFDVWRTRAKHALVAEQMYKQNLARKALRTWRLTMRHDILAEHHEAVVKRDVLQLWVRQERFQLLARTNDRRLARKAMQTFTRNCRKKQDDLRRAFRVLAVARNRSLVHDIFSWWSRKTKNEVQLRGLAADRHQILLTEKVLNVWRDRMDAVNVHNQWAEAAAYYFAAKHAMGRWRSAVENLKKRRIREAYQLISRNRKRKTAARCLGRWRGRLYDQLEREHVADEFAAEGVRESVRDVLHDWHVRTEVFLENHREAEEFGALRLLRLCFDRWTERHRLVRELTLRAQERNAALSLQLMSTYIRRWGTRCWDLSMLQEKGDRLLLRNDSLRVKSILREWRDRVQLRRKQRDSFDAEEEEEEEEGGGLGLGFARTGVVPRASFGVGGGIVTPRKELRTPGWRTTGAAGRRRGLLMGNRTVLGGGGGGTPVGSPGSPLKRFTVFSKSTLGRVVEPDEDDGTLVGSGSGPTIGGRSFSVGRAL